VLAQARLVAARAARDLLGPRATAVRTWLLSLVRTRASLRDMACPERPEILWRFSLIMTVLHRSGTATRFDAAVPLPFLAEPLYRGPNSPNARRMETEQ